MKLLMTGGTGFIGQALALELSRRGHKLIFLTRNPKKIDERYDGLHKGIAWDAMSGPPPKEAFEGIDGIINLMGEGVADKRWSKAQKQKIRDSRVIGTQNLLEGAKAHAPNLKVIVSSSAIGIYEPKQDGPVTEDSPKSKAFLGQVCQEWEAAATVLEPNGIRTVLIRTGIVLGQEGALKKMLTPFLLGVGGRLGNGKQWMNWIHIDDLVQLYVHAVENGSVSGPYNGVAPKNASNQEFTQTLGKVLRRPTIFPVPAFIIKILFGEFSVELLQGAQISAKKTESIGLQFRYPRLENALEAACNVRYITHLKKKIRCQRLHTIQVLPQAHKEVFEFFSDARNLERITPKFLRFKIDKQSTDQIQEGTLFDYKLRVHGIPLKWRTLIEEWQPMDYFVDTQVKGPFRVWHHTHRFTPIKAATLIEDEVYYAVSAIPLADLIAGPFVRRDVRQIFSYRKKTIETFFNQDDAR